VSKWCEAMEMGRPNMKACHLSFVENRVKKLGARYLPFQQNDMPPGPSPAFGDVPVHPPFPWVSMETHSHANGDKFPANVPNLLAVGFGKCEEVCTSKKAFNELKGVLPSHILHPTLKGLCRDLEEFDARIKAREVLEQGVVRRQIVDSNGHHDTCCRQSDAIRALTSFVPVPVLEKCGLVDVAVDPVAVLEVMADQAVDDFDRGEFC